MTNKEGFRILGERAEELSQNTYVQNKMIEITKSEGKENAQKYLYSLAVATLCITPEEFAKYSINR